MKRKRKFQEGGLNPNTTSGAASGLKIGTDFYTKYLEESYDPTIAKDEVDLLKMERKLQKRKNMAGSIGGMTASGAGIGAGVGGAVATPLGSIPGAVVGAIGGLASGIGMGAWLNSAGGRKYQRKVARAKEGIRKKMAASTMAGQNMLQSRLSSMADGGVVSDGDKKKKKKGEVVMQNINNLNLYHYMNEDGLIPKDMGYETFNELDNETKRNMIPDELYENKYIVNDEGYHKINPVYGIYRAAPKQETPPPAPSPEPENALIEYYTPEESEMMLRQRYPDLYKRDGGRIRGMKKGGKVRKRSERKVQKDIDETPASENKNMQAVNMKGLYNYFKGDNLIPEGMTVEDFGGLNYEEQLGMVPDELYPKYNIIPTENPRISSYYVNPVFRPEGDVTYARQPIDRPIKYRQEHGYTLPQGTSGYRRGGKIRKRPTKIKDDDLTSEKAKEILKDGTAHGKPLTDKQKRYFGYVAGKGKAEGGVIEGEGGPKDDAINAKLDVNDFIIPADAPMDVVNDLIEYLGIDKKADVNEGSEEAKVSNGEILIPADMTEKANEYLVSNFEIELDDLAPNAEDKMNLERGGPVKKKDEPVVEIIPELIEKNKKEYEKYEENYLKWHPDKTKEDAKNAYLKTHRVSGSRSAKYPKLNESLKNIATDPLTYAGIATGMQTIGGIAALNRLGDRPERKVDNDLHLLATQTASEAMYGIDPRVKAGIEEQRQRDFTNVTKGIMEYGGGSSGTSYNLLTNAMREKGLADLEITQLDIAEKERKKDIHRNIMMEIINERNRIKEGEIERYDTKEQAYSDLFRSGVENVIGLGKYAAQRKFYKDVEQNITNAPLIGEG